MIGLVNQVGQGNVVQHAVDRPLDLLPHMPGRTVGRPFTVVRVLNTLGRRHRPFETLKHLAERDLIGGPGQDVAPFGAPDAPNEPA